MGQSTPIEIAGHPFDPESIALLQSVLNDIWAELTDTHGNKTPRSLIAGRLIRSAANGERDREVLRLDAIAETEPTVRTVEARPDPPPGALAEGSERAHQLARAVIWRKL